MDRESAGELDENGERCEVADARTDSYIDRWNHQLTMLIGEIPQLNDVASLPLLEAVKNIKGSYLFTAFVTMELMKHYNENFVNPSAALPEIPEVECGDDGLTMTCPLCADTTCYSSLECTKNRYGVWCLNDKCLERRVAQKLLKVDELREDELCPVGGDHSVDEHL